MNLLKYFLFFTLNFLVLMVNAQDFKVIEETKDYILKECDSGYYYSHGLPMKDDFVKDTSLRKVDDGEWNLPLDNGKEIELIGLSKKHRSKNKTFYLDGYDSLHRNYLLRVQLLEGLEWLLINKVNGKIDTLFGIPIYSPSGLFYGSSIFLSNYLPVKFLIFVNSITNNGIGVYVKDESPFDIKWLNDYSALFYTTWAYTSTNGLHPKKYYLVQIKQ